MKTKFYNNIIIILLLAAAIIKPVSIYAQAQEIRIGKTLPDAEINNMLNYSSAHAKISDFKGKLIILDFWATYCAPCVAMFPRTDSLTKLFKGQVQFLSISKEPKIKVATFLKHLLEVRGLKPVAVTNDTLFSRYFYFADIPYYVWIDGDGKVIGTTGSEEITKENIQDILANRKTSFANRTDIRRRPINITDRLYTLNYNFLFKQAGEDTIPMQSTFGYTVATKYIDNATNGKLIFDPARFSIYNCSIDVLFRWAYDVTYYPLPVHGAFDTRITHEFDFKNEKLYNQITLPDNSPFKSGTLEEEKWAHDNAVCFEMIYPKGLTWDEKRELVRIELDKYFAKPMGFSVRVVRRLDTTTMQLVRIDTLNTKIRNSSSKVEVIQDRYSYIQHGKSLDYLTALLNGHYFQGKSVYFINKTGINSPVDIELSCDLTNVSSINTALKAYGLEFQKKASQVDVLIFTDRK